VGEGLREIADQALRPYMIWIRPGSPATASKRHSRHARASSTTMCTRSGVRLRGGLQSTSRTAPLLDLALGLEDARPRPVAAAHLLHLGRGSQKPTTVLGVPRSAAKQAPESKRALLLTGRRDYTVGLQRPALRGSPAGSTPL
jgi:hypothetical protein